MSKMTEEIYQSQPIDLDKVSLDITCSKCYCSETCQWRYNTQNQRVCNKCWAEERRQEKKVIDLSKLDVDKQKQELTFATKKPATTRLKVKRVFGVQDIKIEKNNWCSLHGGYFYKPTSMMQLELKQETVWLCPGCLNQMNRWFRAQQISDQNQTQLITSALSRLEASTQMNVQVWPEDKEDQVVRDYTKVIRKKLTRDEHEKQHMKKLRAKWTKEEAARKRKIERDEKRGWAIGPDGTKWPVLR